MKKIISFVAAMLIAIMASSMPVSAASPAVQDTTAITQAPVQILVDTDSNTVQFMEGGGLNLTGALPDVTLRLEY